MLRAFRACALQGCYADVRKSSAHHANSFKCFESRARKKFQSDSRFQILDVLLPRCCCKRRCFCAEFLASVGAFTCRCMMTSAFQSQYLSAFFFQSVYKLCNQQKSITDPANVVTLLCFCYVSLSYSHISS